MNDAVIEVSNLSKSFGNFVAVNDLHFTVKKGECFALLGPNGAGKTTTCEMLEGLTIPDGGDIVICQKRFATARQEILEEVGVQLQETNLYKKYTVRETFELFASFYNNSEPIGNLLDSLDLRSKADSRLEALSGGQKQRVYLGCSLINRPHLLFLDEPSAGLDPQSRRHFWDLLEGIKRGGRSIFLTTHFMEEAERLADTVAIMDGGKIIAQGTPRDLVARYCQDGGQVLGLTLSPDAITRVQALNPSWLATAHKTGNGFEVAIRTTKDALDFINGIEATGGTVASIYTRHSSLEDVFLKLTGRSIRDA